ncbi:UPF0052-domain-containing protein [Rhizoclosmatium globosum]|uniref:UPF0052-domain-containing protein n=1 Tax=Rhizoclosmatium globosum TaxID=329046 RepID=A0A1Y2CNG9_9FUNG|nr:UPF0052-domain-containing protein [Rhizoclosmatium globosum]|eukprot:ORY47875.1 UPF0052-domain-containing protein [Rhizoclosmatium globosum]
MTTKSLLSEALFAPTSSSQLRQTEVLSSGGGSDAVLTEEPVQLPSKSIAIFSGGSAANNFVSMFQSFTSDITYILPVSDDGGSTSEIVKVVGGPGIGDIRSRLVRLSETKTVEAKAVYKLLSYRLPTAAPSIDGHCPAKMEWLNILEGNHHLWQNISLPYRETIRSFLLQFHYKILKEIGGGGLIITSGGESNLSFDFRGGSLGNFFLTGCRLFFNSLEASIFQFARVTRCPSATSVLPIVATNHNPVAIGCTLRDGSVIFGQCEISHPGTMSNPPPKKPQTLQRQLFAIPRSRSPSTKKINAQPPRPASTTVLSPSRSLQNDSPASSYDMLSLNKQPQLLSKSLDLRPAIANGTSHASLNDTVSTSSNIFFSKSAHETPPLPSPIRRVFYINGERAETFPKINPLVPEQLETKRTIIYAMGSLYTSLLPCLIVPGVGALIAQDWIDARDGGGRRSSVFEDGGGKRVKPQKRIQFQLTPLAPPHHPQNVSQHHLHPLSNHKLHESPPRSSTSTFTRVGPPPPQRVKILLLNGTHDRETTGYTALDFLLSLTDTLNYSVLASHTTPETVKKLMTSRDAKTDMFGAESIWRVFSDDLEDDSGELMEMESEGGRGYLVKPYPPVAYVTHLVYAEDSQVHVNVGRIEAMGVKCVMVPKAGSVEGCLRESVAAEEKEERVAGFFGSFQTEWTPPPPIPFASVTDRAGMFGISTALTVMTILILRATPICIEWISYFLAVLFRFVNPRDICLHYRIFIDCLYYFGFTTAVEAMLLLKAQAMFTRESTRKVVIVFGLVIAGARLGLGAATMAFIDYSSTYNPKSFTCFSKYDNVVSPAHSYYRIVCDLTLSAIFVVPLIDKLHKTKDLKNLLMKYLLNSLLMALGTR